MYLIEMFLVSLLLTLALEFIVAWCYGLRSGKAMMLVLLVNVLTNPLAVLINWLCGVYLPEIAGVGKWIFQLVIECVVVFGEAWIYRSFQKEIPQLKRPFCLAFVANAVSWLCGVLLNGLL